MISLLTKTLDNLCKPNPNSIKDELSRHLIASKNKSILIVHVSIVIFLIIYSILLNDEQVKGITALIVNISLFLLTCRSYRWIYNIYFTFNLVIYAPFMLKEDPNSLPSCWTILFVGPPLVFYASNSGFFYLIQTGIQLVMLCFQLRPSLESYISRMGAETAAFQMTISAFLALSINVFMVLGIDRSLKDAHHFIIKTEVERKNIEKQRYFYLSFSHEIRNLINSMVGSIQICLMDMNLTTKTKAYLNNSKVCGEMLMHSINNIFDKGKLQTGDLDITPTNVMIYDAFKQIWGVSSELIKRKSLSGNLRISKKVPHCLKLDQYRLTQIILNLVGNATKFTEKGFVEIWIAWEKEVTSSFENVPYEDELFEKNLNFGQVDHSNLTYGLEERTFQYYKEQASNPNGALKIVIKDTGPGIPRDQLEKIFSSKDGQDPAERLNTGLGLMISKKLCQSMGGDLRAYSQVGKGSAFIISIPSQAVPIDYSPEVEYLTLEKYLSELNLKALVVDDEHLGRDVLNNFLGRLSVKKIDFADDGYLAFEKYVIMHQEGMIPDVITMDIEMPKFNGKKAASLIRQYELSNNLKPCYLLMISGNISGSEVNHCLDPSGEIRADGFLKKPVSFEEVSKAISTRFYK